MKIRRLKTIVFVLGFLFVLSGLLNSTEAIEVNEDGEVIEPLGKGSINWTTRKLEACGVADPDQPVYGQLKAAQVAARAELLAILKGIRIRGEYGVIDGLLRKDISEVEIEGFLKHSYVTKPKTNELGLIESKAFVYLDRSGNTILMAKKVVPESDAGVWRPPATITPSSARYTGLIIDARGMNLRPAIAPRILTEGDFLNVYGSNAVDQEFARTYGFAGYAGTMEKARKMKDRIGKSPLEIRAIDAVNVSDVVVSKEDAVKIASALISHDFLKECRVVIVVD